MVITWTQILMFFSSAANTFSKMKKINSIFLIDNKLK